MENLQIQNSKNQIILRINKRGFDKGYLLRLIKRLQLEDLAFKSHLKDDDVDSIAEEINNSWWKQHGEDFLKNVVN